METPLIVALARQMSVQDEIDVIANNLANMSTGAYKAERVLFKDYLAPLPSGGDAVVFPKRAALDRIDAPGPIARTSNPLDVAIRGDGYFAVETPEGVRYTRNGHFRLDETGRLVTGDGHPVLDSGDRPLAFEPGVGKITIAPDGTVSADDEALGRLKVVTFEDTQQLKRLGGTLYATAAPPVPATEAEILQNHLEGSNVQPILEITRFMQATGHYQHAKKVIDDEHERQRRAIQTLGNVPE